jgi:hypothetical protein
LALTGSAGRGCLRDVAGLYAVLILAPPVKTEAGIPTLGAIPVQQLRPVSLPVGEREDLLRKRIERKFLLDENRQAVEKHGGRRARTKILCAVLNEKRSKGEIETFESRF